MTAGEPESARLIVTAAASHGDSELIDDRSLESLDDDKLHLEDIVEEVARVVVNVRTPAALALYGAWGSGKSSLGNLLRTRFAGEPKVAFAKFDAFKFTETPLRRHVISQVAREVGIDDPEFSTGLYETESKNRLSLPSGSLKAILGIALLVVAIVLVFVTGVVALVAWLDARRFGDAFPELFSKSIGGALASASVLAAFITLALNRLTVTSSASAPSSAEAFEKRFGELVDRVIKGKPERLVVFVDELDRCSPEDVVVVLDTIRTFLELEHCVFVVAADQQVLEQALRERARQATPRDSSNPYYSAGSAYLDKVFTYQMSLPPFHTRRMSQFAIELVSGRAGVWGEIDVPRVVSVLVPTHVRSPRRVKALLNAFVLTYRLARQRHSEDLLADPPSDRSIELAKLVCLRTEFPLFAADLSFEPRLPELVLALEADPDARKPGGVADDAWSRASLYAHGDIPVETNLVTVAEVASPAVDEPAASDEDDGAQGTGTDNLGEVRDAVEGAQHLQLIRYLKRTSRVPGPRRDLIFMESAGAAFDLEPSLAERLEDAAVDNLVDEVTGLVSSLDDAEQAAALRMLARRVLEAPPGVEADNCVSTLLQAVGMQLDTAISPIADDLAEAITVYEKSDDVPPAELRGVLRIGLCTHDAARRGPLISSTMERDEILQDDALALFVLENARVLLDLVPDRIADLFAYSLFQDSRADALLGTLSTLDDTEASSLVVSSIAHYAVHAKRVDDGEESEEPRAVIDVGNTPTIISALLQRALDDGASRTAESLAQLALGVDEAELRHLVERHLGRLERVESPELARGLLAATGRRMLGEWSRWITVTDPENLPHEVAAQGRADLAASLWSSGVRPREDQPDLDTVREAAAAVGRLAEGEEPSSELVERVRAAISVAAADEESLGQRQREYDVAELMSDAGLLTRESVSDAALAGLMTTLGAAIPVEDPDGPFSQFLIRRLSWLRFASRDALTELQSAIGPAGWLGPPARANVNVSVAAALREQGQAVDSPVPLVELGVLVASHGDLMVPALSAWLTGFQPGVEDLRPVLDPLMRLALPPGVAGALREGVDLSDSDRLDLVRGAITDTAQPAPSADFLDSIRFSDCDQMAAAGILVEALGDSTDEQVRRRVLAGWSSLKPDLPAARRQLVNEVLLPIARADAAGFDVALEFAQLASPAPRGTSESIVEAFRDSPFATSAMKNAAKAKLMSLQLAKRKGLWGGNWAGVE